MCGEAMISTPGPTGRPLAGLWLRLWRLRLWRPDDTPRRNAAHIDDLRLLAWSADVRLAGADLRVADAHHHLRNLQPRRRPQDAAADVATPVNSVPGIPLAVILVRQRAVMQSAVLRVVAEGQVGEFQRLGEERRGYAEAGGREQGPLQRLPRTEPVSRIVAISKQHHQLWVTFKTLALSMATSASANRPAVRAGANA